VIPPLLRGNAPFRHFWLGQTVSLFGDQVTTLALPLTAVLVLHASASEMGYLTAVVVAPNLLFALHFGAWVDRRGGRRTLMLAADVARCGLLVSIAVAYALGVLRLWQLYAVAFCSGTFTVLFYVAYSSLFAALVPRESYVAASQLLNGSRAFSYVGGPSIAGVLVQLASAPGALLADAASFLVSAGFLRSIAPVEPETEPAERSHLAAGVRFIRDTPTLRASLLSTAWVNYFNYVAQALFVLYATRSLHVHPRALGLVLGGGAVGGVVGSLLTGRISRRIGIGLTFVAGSALFPAGYLAVPAAGGPHALVLAVLAIGEFVAGFGVMLLDISVNSIALSLVPDRLRARFSGAYMVVNNGVRPLGALTGGLLGSAIGLRTTLWFAAVGGIASVLFLLPSPVPGMRELPEQVA
jgi:MFS family permease